MYQNHFDLTTIELIAIPDGGILTQDFVAYLDEKFIPVVYSSMSCHGRLPSMVKGRGLHIDHSLTTLSPSVQFLRNSP